MVFALAAIKIKQYGYPLKLHCVLPCKNYQSSNSLYDYIKNRADEWVELSDDVTYIVEGNRKESRFSCFDKQYMNACLEYLGNPLLKYGL